MHNASRALCEGVHGLGPAITDVSTYANERGALLHPSPLSWVTQIWNFRRQTSLDGAFAATRVFPPTFTCASPTSLERNVHVTRVSLHALPSTVGHYILSRDRQVPPVCTVACFGRDDRSPFKRVARSRMNSGRTFLLEIPNS